MVENYFTKQLWLERRNLHIKRTKCVLKFGVRNWQSIMQLFAIDDKMYNDNFVEGVKGNFWGKVSLFGYHFFVINRQLLRTNCLFFWKKMTRWEVTWWSKFLREPPLLPPAPILSSFFSFFTVLGIKISRNSCQSSPIVKRSLLNAFTEWKMLTGFTTREVFNHSFLFFCHL